MAPQLPDDISLSLVRGVGAFIRATGTQDLPGPVRRFKQFRPAALASKSDELLAFLFDETTLPRVNEWILKGKPPLAKDDLENLRIAAAQEEGWTEALAERSSVTGETTSASGSEVDKLQKSLERERAKTQKQKEEARRHKDEAAEEKRRAKVATASLEKQVLELTKTVTSLEKKSAQAEFLAQAATEERDRELRRARSDVTKAESEVGRLREEVRSARREAVQFKQKVLDLEEQAKKKKRPKSKPQAADPTEPTGPRGPLPVPKGRYEDDSETLQAWVETPGLLLLIDGYNVTRHESGYPSLPFSSQRQRLLDGVERLARNKNIKATIVWDAQYMTATERPAATTSRRSPVTEIFTSEGEIADDRIVKLLESTPPYPAVVATNDRELRERVGALGATVATSPQLLALLT